MKHTSGGKFDPESGPLVFAATNPSAHVKSGLPNVLVAVNEIETRADVADLDRLLDERRVLLDSGIYNLAMGHARSHGMTMDQALALHPAEVDGFTELKDRYYTLVTEHRDRLWGVIELDLGGAKVKPETRAMIERDTRVIPMPVYHPFGDGWDYYDTIAADYDRMCFGNLVKAVGPIRVRLIHTAAERARAYPHLWTHLLGVNPSERSIACGMRGSNDSSSWLTGVRWYPSWKLHTLLRRGEFAVPPTMWPGGRDSKTAGRGHGTALAAADHYFVQRVVDAIATDTHPLIGGATSWA